MSIEEAVELLAGALPEGITVAICVERGAAWVEWIDHYGDMRAIEPNDEPLAEQLARACKEAQEQPR